MNGWADPDPAWLLNLKADPAANVDLVEGPRAVIARLAAGDERSRLWERWDAHGENLASYAGLSGDTHVVILEPPPPEHSRPSTLDRSATERAGRANQRGCGWSFIFCPIRLDEPAAAPSTGHGIHNRRCRTTKLGETGSRTASRRSIASGQTTAVWKLARLADYGEGSNCKDSGVIAARIAHMSTSTRRPASRPTPTAVRTGQGSGITSA